MANNIMTTGTLTSMITPITSTISTIGDRMSIAEEKIDELYRLIEELRLATAPRTNGEIVKPNEKSDLEILEQNSRNELKYIDLDEVNKEKEFWELYDENWWNK